VNTEKQQCCWKMKAWGLDLDSWVPLWGLWVPGAFPLCQFPWGPLRLISYIRNRRSQGLNTEKDPRLGARVAQGRALA
jgi:hypothetical protein